MPNQKQMPIEVDTKWIVNENMKYKARSTELRVLPTPLNWKNYTATFGYTLLPIKKQ